MPPFKTPADRHSNKYNFHEIQIAFLRTIPCYVIDIIYTTLHQVTLYYHLTFDFMFIWRKFNIPPAEFFKESLYYIHCTRFLN